MLDLIFSNEEGMICNVNYLPGLGRSDHICLLFQLNLYTNDSASKKESFRFPKGDYEAMNLAINNQQWDMIRNSPNVNNAWDDFHSTILNLMNIHIPKSRNRHNKKKNPWMTREAIRLHRQKCMAWRRYRISQEPGDEATARLKSIELNKLTCNLEREFEIKLAEDVKTHPKSFWKYSNDKLKTRDKVNDLLKENGSLTKNDNEKAEVLNSFFKSVFTVEDTSQLPEPQGMKVDQVLSTVEITPLIVKNKLLKLNKSKSTGPDLIHPWVLSETAGSICIPLAMIFTKSMEQGIVPSSWKQAHVNAIFKKGDRKEAKNYRPISLTSVCGKVLESIVRDKIVSHMMTNNLFCDEQHGFVPGRSCVTQLLCVMEMWTNSLNSREEIDCIYLDFQKAFDTVPHARLISKLKAYGMEGPLIRWITNFLSNRIQRVVVNNEMSTWSTISSGTPQGSVLGPTFFVVFINDIPDSINSTVNIFADDTKLFRSVTSDEEHVVLQSDLDMLADWSETWQLKFNASKCKVLHIGQHDTNYEYYLGNSKLENTTMEKDLGVIMDGELKFHNHVAQAAKKASGVLAQIRRTMACHNETTITLLYKGIVRPLLEYANVIWHPRYKMDMEAIETVQRRATKLVPELRNVDYSQRLKILKLPSMQYRLRRGDMIQVYKIVKGLDRVPSEMFFKFCDASDDMRQTRGHNWKIFKPQHTLDVRKHTFSVRIINDWNSLSAEVVNAESLNIFKNKLDKLWVLDMYRNPFNPC